MLSWESMAQARDLRPITSPDDPRLAAMGYEEIAGASQIPQMLAASPDTRLQYLLDMLEFEREAHAARLILKTP